MSRHAQLKLFAVTTPEPAALPDGARWRTVTTPYQSIGFVLQRSRRRSIGFIVDDTGLRVTAPTWATRAQIDAAVVARSRWIMEKLQLRQQRLEHQAAADKLWKHQGRIPYLGIHIALKLCAAQKEVQFSGIPEAPRKDDKLVLALPENASEQRIQDSVHTWLQRQATW